MVIPKPLRERLGLRGGQLMEIREERGQLIVTKSADDDRIGSVYGILREMREPEGFTRTDDFIREVRGGDADAVDPASSET